MLLVKFGSGRKACRMPILCKSFIFVVLEVNCGHAYMNCPLHWSKIRSGRGPDMVKFICCIWWCLMGLLLWLVYSCSNQTNAGRFPQGFPCTLIVINIDQIWHASAIQPCNWKFLQHDLPPHPPRWGLGWAMGSAAIRKSCNAQLGTFLLGSQIYSQGL